MACRILAVLQAIALALAVTPARGDAVDDQLAAIGRTGPQGAGSAAARAACDELAGRDAQILPRLLTAMQTDNPVAANWYRTAYEAIIEREFDRASPQFPLAELQAFVRDPKHAGRVRRLALRLCDRLDPNYSPSIIPGLLDDIEFRADAVEVALAAGGRALESGDSEAAREAFHRAFEHARDSAQTVRAADKLAGLGEKVDIAAHLGLVVDWWLIGPFDAPQFSGFAREFPPEQRADAIDLKDQYSGQEGRQLAWVRHRTPDPLGLVNLVQTLAPAKEAVGYAYTEVISPRDQDAELRCGADDNCTVWRNGRKVFGREQWLNGIRFDRFTAPVRFERGTNRVLVKVCQGPPNKDPQVSNNWSLQLRFCDASGTGLDLRLALPEISEAPK
jgi:hypothetical protein